METELQFFFYTGNESPVEEYVNNTGLMWNLAKDQGALVIFAEHRYFGESVPEVKGMRNCMSYLSSQEALADYASLINRMKRTMGAQDSAVIAFGGSYGGMLASWMRLTYPSAVDGAIAASAPIWGFPLDGVPMDSSAQVVSYAASAAAGATDNCASNLKSGYVLISHLGKTAKGRELLSKSMNLCSPLSTSADVQAFLSYLKIPLFDLAEGSYPFPSDYITFALLGTTEPLPPWPMQVMCKPLGQDFGAKIFGSEADVKFTLNFLNENKTDVKIFVDWDQTTDNSFDITQLSVSPALDLAAAVAQSSQIWYNVTGESPSCIDWRQIAGAKKSKSKTTSPKKKNLSAGGLLKPRNFLEKKENTTESDVCFLEKSDIDAGTAWNALVCNEGINLVNTVVQGVGKDLYWPPNVPKNYSLQSIVPGSLAFCGYLKRIGLPGVPEKGDDWAFWVDTAYGGRRLDYATNIVFSNGNLDPWSPAGVSFNQEDKSRKAGRSKASWEEEAEGVVSVSIDMGGHHLDLFWPTENDPESVRAVRELEEEQIKLWISNAKKPKNI